MTNPGSATAVKGSAYGYRCDVEVFGDHSPTEPTPSATLAPDASNSPQSASVASARADAGPATIFSSGRIDVSTTGTLGPNGGSVTSSVNIANLGVVGEDSFAAGSLASTCTASESGVSGSTTITGGLLVTDNGDGDHDRVTVTLPTNPPPDTTYEGILRIGSRTDTFRWVFNEQIVNADGSIIVNAAHQYLLGPMATGELIVGQVVCGITVGEPAPPPNCA